MLAYIGADILETTFTSQVSRRAQTPLKSYQSASKIQCAAFCGRTVGCAWYSSDPDTQFCQLWPNSTENNPLGATSEPLFKNLHPRLPEGFERFDASVAFGLSISPSSGGMPSIISRCREVDPRAVPAIPRTMDELLFFDRFGSNSLVGLTDINLEGTFTNMVTGELVNVPAEFWEKSSPTYLNSASNNCVYIHLHGRAELVSVTCAGLFSVICEIRN